MPIRSRGQIIRARHGKRYTGIGLLDLWRYTMGDIHGLGLLSARIVGHDRWRILLARLHVLLARWHVVPAR